jgi:drug/metabolite transporter (DMT)-like permease
MLQKHLRSGALSTAGSTFSRFIYSAPIVLVIAIAYANVTAQGMPGLSLPFWAYVMTGGLGQILATMCVVALFTQRNFAVGITFKKTEVLLAAIIGFVILGDAVTGLTLIAILIGLAGVLLLSDPPEPTGVWYARVFNKAAGLGLLSGVLFGISGVAYRGATLAVDHGDTFYRAIVALACATAFQATIMAVWLAFRERGEIGRVLAAWRVAGLVGITSMIGSLCWFIAFTLQTVALVKAVGQAELLLSLLAGWLVFGETISKREWQGLALLGVSIVMLILVT